ncbi:MAG: hypothetical protein ACHREM_06770 [Polyangiales bacterium]
MRAWTILILGVVAGCSSSSVNSVSGSTYPECSQPFLDAPPTTGKAGQSMEVFSTANKLNGSDTKVYVDDVLAVINLGDTGSIDFTVPAATPKGGATIRVVAADGTCEQTFHATIG